jgi:hypothetical protein
MCSVAVKMKIKLSNLHSTIFSRRTFGLEKIWKSRQPSNDDSYLLTSQMVIYCMDVCNV